MARERYGKRYVNRGRKGRFTKNVSVKRSQTADRRKQYAKVVKTGLGDKGDLATDIGADARKAFKRW